MSTARPSVYMGPANVPNGTASLPKRDRLEKKFHLEPFQNFSCKRRLRKLCVLTIQEAIKKIFETLTTLEWESKVKTYR